jgi:hypothetical protein
LLIRKTQDQEYRVRVSGKRYTLPFCINKPIQCQIRRIQDEIDRTESKLETLSSTADTGKKRGKKDDSKRNDKEVKNS